MRYEHPPYYLSAYSIACRHGFTGSEEEWLESLRGPKGEPGNVSFEELTEEQRESLRGPQGIQGAAGPRGEQGIQGERGESGEPGTRFLLFWENKNLDNEFPEQVIPMDLSRSKGLFIVFLTAVDAGGCVSSGMILPNGRFHSVFYHKVETGSLFRRTVRATQTEIEFTNGVIGDSYSRSVMIPMAVYNLV